MKHMTIVNMDILIAIVVGPHPWLRQIPPWEILTTSILMIVMNLHPEGHRQKETQRLRHSITKVWIKMALEFQLKLLQGCWEAQSPRERVNHKAAFKLSKQVETWNNIWNPRLGAQMLSTDPIRPSYSHQLQRQKLYTPIQLKVGWCQNSMQPIRIWQWAICKRCLNLVLSIWVYACLSIENGMQPSRYGGILIVLWIIILPCKKWTRIQRVESSLNATSPLPSSSIFRLLISFKETTIRPSICAKSSSKWSAYKQAMKNLQVHLTRNNWKVKWTWSVPWISRRTVAASWTIWTRR